MAPAPGGRPLGQQQPSQQQQQQQPSQQPSQQQQQRRQSQEQQQQQQQQQQRQDIEQEAWEARDKQEQEQESGSDSDSALEYEEAEATAGEDARRTVIAAEEQLPMTGEELLQYLAHLRAQLAHIKPTLMQIGAPPQAEAGTDTSGTKRGSFSPHPTLAHAASRRLVAQAEVSAGADPPPMLSAERACAALQRSAPVYLSRQSALLLQQQPPPQQQPQQQPQQPPQLPPPPPPQQQQQQRAPSAPGNVAAIEPLARLRGMTAVVVGLGRVGSRAAQLLAKMGVGRLLLVDRGSVTAASLPGSAFAQEHRGTSKAQAARLLCLESAPGVMVQGLQLDIAKPEQADVVRRLLDNYWAERGAARLGGAHEGAPARAIVRADVVLSSLGRDTAARIALNRLCLEAGVSHLSAQSDADGGAAAINLVVPGKTACLCCLAAKDEAAAASATKRPSSMPVAPGSRSAPASEPEPGDPAEHAYSPGLPLMLAGLLAQNAVKLHLGLGSVLAGFRHKYGADTVAIPGAVAPPAPEAALVLQPSKEFRSFNTEPFLACPETVCRRQHQREQQEQQDARDSAAAAASVQQQQHHHQTYTNNPPVI